MSNFKLYEIHHPTTDSFYIGVVAKRNKTIDQRFHEHLSGCGSVAIKKLIDDGATKHDFVISLISDHEYLIDAYDAEIEAIRKLRIAGVNLLNMNGGGGFRDYIQNRKFIETRGYCKSSILQPYNTTEFQTLLELNTLNSKINRIFEGCTRYNSAAVREWYRFLLQWSDVVYNINVDVVDVERLFNLTRINPHIFFYAFVLYKNDTLLYQYLINLNFTELKNFAYCMSVYKNTGNTVIFKTMKLKLKKSDLYMWYKSEYKTKFNSASDTEAHKIGRENYKKRISNKNYTDNEIKAFVEKSDIIKRDWQSRVKEDPYYKQNRCSPGMEVRNAKIHKCSYCGKDKLTLGNLKRWHNENCKDKKN